MTWYSVEVEVSDLQSIAQWRVASFLCPRNGGKPVRVSIAQVSDPSLSPTKLIHLPCSYSLCSELDE